MSNTFITASQSGKIDIWPAQLCFAPQWKVHAAWTCKYGALVVRVQGLFATLLLKGRKTTVKLAEERWIRTSNMLVHCLRDGTWLTRELGQQLRR